MIIDDSSIFSSINYLSQLVDKGPFKNLLAPMTLKVKLVIILSRPLVKSAYQKNNFLISQPKHYVVGTQKNHLNETGRRCRGLVCDCDSWSYCLAF